MTLEQFYVLFIKDLYNNGMVSFVERNDCGLITDEWQCSVNVIECLRDELLNKKVTSWEIVKDKYEDYGYMLQIELTEKEQTK